MRNDWFEEMLWKVGHIVLAGIMICTLGVFCVLLIAAIKYFL